MLCPFHSWVYSNTGELRHVPDEEDSFDLDKRTLGLTPVHTDTWEGFVFCHLDSEPGETLRQYLGGLADQLDGCQFSRMKLTSTHITATRTRTDCSPRSAAAPASSP